MAELLVSRALVEELLFLSEAKISNIRLGPNETVQFTITGDNVPDTDGPVNALIELVNAVKSIRFITVH